MRDLKLKLEDQKASHRSIEKYSTLWSCTRRSAGGRPWLFILGLVFDIFQEKKQPWCIIRRFGLEDTKTHETSRRLAETPADEAEQRNRSTVTSIRKHVGCRMCGRTVNTKYPFDPRSTLLRRHHISLWLVEPNLTLLGTPGKLPENFFFQPSRKSCGLEPVSTIASWFWWAQRLWGRWVSLFEKEQKYLWSCLFWGATEEWWWKIFLFTKTI